MSWPELANRLDLLVVASIALLFWGTDKLMEGLGRRF
jgi:hypothetical protein